MRYTKGPEKKRRKGYIGVSRTTLRALWGDECYLCGRTMLFNPRDNASPLYATLEHVIPRSKGGQKTWDNIKLSCRECNSDKSHMDLEEYLDYLITKETENRENE